jgi:hypothetical protein
MIKLKLHIILELRNSSLSDSNWGGMKAKKRDETSRVLDTQRTNESVYESNHSIRRLP